MREVEGEEAGRLSFFMYEIIDAFRRAAETTGLKRTDIENVFYQNAAGLFDAVRKGAPRQQLQMVWPKKLFNDPPQRTVPDGYTLRTYREGDDDDYKRLMDRAGFKNWSDADAKNVLNKCLPDGLFFVVNRGTGTLAATAAAVHNSIEGQGTHACGYQRFSPAENPGYVLHRTSGQRP
ncbi:hypothetical protein ACFLQR_04495 [Verrucomicrobiota bacterium]